MIGVRRGSGACRRGVALLAGLAALLGLVPTPSSGQRIGLFLDEEALICQAPIAYFDVVHLWVIGYPPPDSQLTGAVFSLELPPDLFVLEGSLRVHREVVRSIAGDLEGLKDISLGFIDCVQSSEPFPLLEFDVWEGSATVRGDLRARLVGAAVDSLMLSQPVWKTCEPGDPEGYRSLVHAPSVDVVFNCTRACYCTTAVHNRTWSFVKSLYQGN